MYIADLVNLSTNGRGWVKNPQNLVNVVNGCPLINKAEGVCQYQISKCLSRNDSISGRISFKMDKMFTLGEIPFV